MLPSLNKSASKRDFLNIVVIPKADSFWTFLAEIACGSRSGLAKIAILKSITLGTLVSLAEQLREECRQEVRSLAEQFRKEGRTGGT